MSFGEELEFCPPLFPLFDPLPPLPLPPLPPLPDPRLTAFTAYGIAGCVSSNVGVALVTAAETGVGDEADDWAYSASARSSKSMYVF